MTTLLASIVPLGSTVGAIAVELDLDYQSYIDVKVAVTAREIERFEDEVLLGQ